MKYSLLTLFFLIFSISVFSQETAITERGDTVYLYSNGTWSYYQKFVADSDVKSALKVNPTPYSIPSSATSKINGLNSFYELWYDAKKWKRVPVGGLNQEADIALEYLKGEVFAMVIFEEIEIPMESLSSIALDNAGSAAPDIKMIDREIRTVNNDSLICMQMDGSAQGMKISYYSYYYSNPKGSVQFHTFTGQNLLPKYKADMDELLNGIIFPHPK